MSIKEEIRRAIALAYDPEGNRAPKVVAKGLGPIADAIINIAQKHGIQFHQDEALARSLYVLELGQEIPEEFYVAIAEVLAFVYRVDKKLRKKRGFQER
jgi:flagellar biosynthesis protein